MGVSENRGTPKSSILIGFSIINHPFWGIPIFGNTPMFSRLHHFFIFRQGETIQAKEGLGENGETVEVEGSNHLCSSWNPKANHFQMIGYQLDDEPNL